MPALLILFVVVTLASAGFELLLQLRQARHVARHRDAVPPAFAATVSLADHRKAADYARASLRLGCASTAYGAAMAIGWAVFGYDALYGAVAGWMAPGLARGVAFLLAAGAISSLLGLPFALVRVFGIEARFGFNRQTWAGFLRDRAKGAALSLALATPLLAGLLWLLGRTGPGWDHAWLWAWLALMAVMLVMIDAYPRWIAPLFNRFTPLEGSLRTRIEALLARCGFQSSGLFVMDASRRSSRGNAYFSGLGRSKRIVLFDTLVDAHDEDELEAVLAHELGHFKLNHILIGLAQSAVTSLLGLLAIFWLARQPWLLPEFGIAHQDLALSLVVCLLLVQMGSPLLGIGANWLSRRHEFQADDFARRMVGADPMVRALVRLSRDNASTLTTDPLYALVNYSHPPVPQRVARLLQSEGVATSAASTA